MMGKMRPINSEKYEVSKHRFYELYHYCMQYNEWIDMLKYDLLPLSSKGIDGQPRSRRISDTTRELAMKRNVLEKKIEAIEQAAIEADEDIYPYILKAVTNEGITYRYLDTIMCIPCGKNTYYNRRRKFYWLLSKKI